jgi:hypothetical protein
MKRIVFSAFILTIAFSLASCSGGKVKKYSAEDFTIISVSGSNGDGIISVSADGQLLGAIRREVLGDEPNMYDDAALQVLFYAGDTFYYDVDKRTNLSNGDVVNIELVYSVDNFEAKGISFTNTKFKHTVSGLIEPTTLDVFTGLKLNYSGISKNGTIEIDNSGCDDYVKENVRFNIEDLYNFQYKAANGDIVTVTASYNPRKISEDNFVIESDTMNFTVEGLPFYIESNEGYDFSAVEARLEAKMVEEFADYLTVGAKEYSIAVVGSKGNVVEFWTVNSKELTPETALFFVHKNFYDNSKQYTNSYVKVYKITVNATKIYDKWVKEENGDGFPSGTPLDIVTYASVYMHGIIDNGDGTLNLDKATVYYSFHNGRTSLFSTEPSWGYPETLEDLIRLWEQNNPDWTYVKLY